MGEGYDIAIVGGGPAGSTLATLVRKYHPELSVVILEKERFPREHVGESHLPAISGILHEMGAWDKVEEANFPIKIGASLTWGRDNESWDFDFFPVEEFKDEPRPAKFEGQRTYTAFQVDRAQYDDILLRHAASMGVEVREETRVAAVRTDGDRVAGFELESGEVVTARYYVDASGASGFVRRALGIESDAPEELRNVAFWDYWENAEWAVKIGVGGTRIQIRSLPFGWLWFIPLGPTRTSIGLVCPAAYYKSCGRKVDDLYYASVRGHEQIGQLVANATPRGKVESTRDWSHLARRVAGPNWFLIGEAAGFADPILSAGMTLAHTSAREAAYAILELQHNDIDHARIRRWYDEKTRRNIDQHIRFAKFWYATNRCFSDLQAHCADIARSAGLKLTPKEAWRWLAQGGFTNRDSERAVFGSFDVGAARRLVDKFGDGTQAGWELEKHTTLKLNLLGAKRELAIVPAVGRLRQVECYRRGDRTLALTGTFGNLVTALKAASGTVEVFQLLDRSIRAQFPPDTWGRAISDHMYALEAMLHEGWVQGKVEPGKPKLRATDVGERFIRATAEGLKALEARNVSQPRTG